MEFPPVADELGLSARKCTLEDPPGGDVHDRLVIAIPCMEVRDAMLPAVDVDEDAVEGGDARHGTNVLTAGDNSLCVSPARVRRMHAATCPTDSDETTMQSTPTAPLEDPEGSRVKQVGHEAHTPLCNVLLL